MVPKINATNRLNKKLMIERKSILIKKDSHTRRIEKLVGNVIESPVTALPEATPKVQVKSYLLTADIVRYN